MLRSQKRNSGVSFNDTLLNFGLSSFYTVQPVLYCIFKHALDSLKLMTVGLKSGFIYGLNHFRKILS